MLNYVTVTFLLQDGISGLEIENPHSNGWISIPSTKGVYIVNVGNLLQKWTSDYYKSAAHSCEMLVIFPNFAFPHDPV